jgi:hypothetical protein
VRRTHRAGAPALALLLAVICGAAVLLDAKVKVHTQRDKDFSLRGLRTWAWHPDGAGEVKMVSTPSDDPAAFRTRFEPVIKDAIERALTARQFTPAPPGTPPDLYVVYYLLVSTNTSQQTIGQNVTAEMHWQIPDFAKATQSFEIFEQGSLVLDVSSPATRALVWRGVAQARIDRQRTPAERDSRLRDAIDTLIGKFPKS